MADLPHVESLAGDRPGPVVGLLGGVHGDELEGVLAIRIVRRMLSPGSLRGSLRWAAPAHPAAWLADTRAGPDDGVNLARVFPGDRSGTETPRVAAALTDQLIAGCDLLIDLHSAGRGFDMPLLVGFHSTGPLADAAAGAAHAFAAPFVWEHPDSAAGRSLSAAEALGIPSVYVEGHGGGQLRQHELDGYVGGVLRVLAHLDMIDQAPPAGPVTIVRGDGNTDEGITAPASGYFVTATEAGRAVTAGDLLGRVLGEDGDVLADVPAPVAGAVMLLRRNARVSAGDTLAIVGETVPPAGGAKR